MMTLEQKTQRQATLTVAHFNYSKRLNLHAFFKVSDQMMSDDLVQQTFLKTWSYLVKGGKIDLMKAFLYHILNDLIVDEYRKRKTISLNALLEKGYEPNAGDFRRLFNILDGKAALLLIQKLPEKYQKVMHMRYMQELTLEEISLITKQTKNTVTVQAHRGLVKLKLLYDSPHIPIIK